MSQVHILTAAPLELNILKNDENWNLTQGGGVESNITQQIPITEWEFTIGTTEGTDMIGTKKIIWKGVVNFLYQYFTCVGLGAKGADVGLKTLQGILYSIPLQDWQHWL